MWTTVISGVLRAGELLILWSGKESLIYASVQYTYIDDHGCRLHGGDGAVAPWPKTSGGCPPQTFDPGRFSAFSRMSRAFCILASGSTLIQVRSISPCGYVDCMLCYQTDGYEVRIVSEAENRQFITL